MSDLSDTTKGANGTAQGVEPNPKGASPIDCASDVLQLLELQKWIKQNLELK
jgi:hypothetical protein